MKLQIIHLLVFGILAILVSKTEGFQSGMGKGRNSRGRDDDYHLNELKEKIRETLEDVEKLKESLQDMSNQGSNDESADLFDEDESIGGEKREYDNSEEYDAQENEEEQNENDEEDISNDPIKHDANTKLRFRRRFGKKDGASERVRHVTKNNMEEKDDDEEDISNHPIKHDAKAWNTRRTYFLRRIRFSGLGKRPGKKDGASEKVRQV